MLPNAFGEIYVNDPPYEFSINYPNGWMVEEYQSFYDHGVTFSDQVDWTTNIMVWHYENVGTKLSDNREIASILPVQQKPRMIH